MSLRICIAGVTGWTGSCVARAILEKKAAGFELVGAVARKAAGRDAGEALGLGAAGVAIRGTLKEALASGADVLVDYTSPLAVKSHVLEALDRGVSVVVGTSGMTAADYDEIGQAARKAGKGVVAAGNFSVTAALVKRFALLASDHLPQWEIVDYAHAEKIDAPSGTARELAEALGERNRNRIARPLDEIIGPREARGAQVQGTPVHSVRLPGYVISFEALFGLPHERLTLRHDAGTGAEPYVNGTLLAARKAVGTVGLVRGLDTLLFGGG